MESPKHDDFFWLVCELFTAWKRQNRERRACLTRCIRLLKSLTESDDSGLNHVETMLVKTCAEAKDREVLHYWPTNGKWWEPNGGAKGIEPDAMKILERAREVAERMLP